MARNQNILLIRLKSIGDIVFTLPAVTMVRESFPDAKITFLTSRENVPLLEGFREVDEVIALDRARFRSGNPAAVLGGFLSLLRQLRREKFSLVVDFQGYGETAWMAWLTGAPQRWGSVYGKGRRWAYTHGVTRNQGIHHADWNLSLLQQCGLHPGKIYNEFVLPETALDAARLFFRRQNLDVARPTLFIQPYTSTPKKNWPLKNYLALAAHWQLLGMQIIFGGGPSERAALEPARAAGFIVSAGTPVLVSAGLMKLSTLAVGGVTGLMHLAVAMQKRVVMLIGHSAGESCFPYQHPDWALTPTSGTKISEIQTVAVIEACARAFSEQTCNALC